MQKGQDEVLAKEAVEFCVLIREQLGYVLTAAPPIDVRGSQCRPALKVLPDRFNAKVLLDNPGLAHLPRKLACREEGFRHKRRQSGLLERNEGIPGGLDTSKHHSVGVRRASVGAERAADISVPSKFPPCPCARKFC
jgi:hypothetical protein